MRIVRFLAAAAAAVGMCAAPATAQKSGGTLQVYISANPSSIITDPTGRFAYVTNFGFNTISHFSIAADGTLTLVSTVFGQAGPFSMAIR